MMTRKEVSVAARVGMTTLYKFESGNMTDISFGTVIRLLIAIGMVENWEALLPELPESPYMYDDNGKKIQRYSCNLYYYRNDKNFKYVLLDYSQLC
ncbi:MAG: helix-turn-helix transcriptional regulator [Muribaculaceae bacterium]|nr:helix-turn-helix transcriptional regulator [Muribaculaceae bacterium]